MGGEPDTKGLSQPEQSARLEPEPTVLWTEVKELVDLKMGVLVIDDTTLDKPYGPKIELVKYHWSGKHKAVVQGINLITLMWTDGKVSIPVDYRIFDKERDQKTKNDHFLDMLHEAHTRGFQPAMVLFDSWYSSVKNLKAIRKKGWTFLTVLKSNRIVSVTKDSYLPVSNLILDEEGTIVHLRKFGFIRAFRIAPPDGSTKAIHSMYQKAWITNAQDMEVSKRKSLIKMGNLIEQYHRTLKQECNVERCQARLSIIQRNHIGLSIRAFVRLEINRFLNKDSIWHAKRNLFREAIRAYLKNPSFLLSSA